MLMNGAELVIRLLENQGITRITGIPGGFNLPLYDALSKSKKIRHVLARHEQGAGFIAQGMARSTGKPAVFFATSGPGATNAITAIADARLDSIPLICITGQVPLAMIGTDSFQEVDIYGMSIPVTKHNFLVRSVEELLEVIPEAFRIAASGRPGPVLVDIPKDIQNASISIEQMPQPGVADEPLGPPPKLLQEAASAINTSQRPIFYFGGGTAKPATSALALALVENFDIPATMSLQGLGVIPVKHPLSLGMLGMHGARCTNMLIEECDLLIVTGARFDDRATGRMDKFCPNARVIHIDIDVSEMDKLRPANIGLVSDAEVALKGLAHMLEKKDRSDWVTRVAQIKEQYPLALRGSDSPCTAYGIICQAAEMAQGEVFVTTDVGQHQMRVAQAYPLKRTRQLLTSGGLGTMGFGLPAAIGAAFEHPEATVLCFSGDGSLLMNIQEMATAVEENANVKILLCNNNGLGLVQQQQNLFYEGRVFGSTYNKATNFALIANGFGMPAINLCRSSKPKEVLQQALLEKGPCLIEVELSADDMVFPMVPPGAANVEMLGGE